MTIAKAYAVSSPTAAFAPFQVERRAVGAHDVQIEIAFCGICHSDIHQAVSYTHLTLPTNREV